jgi:hypothetical protein
MLRKAAKPSHPFDLTEEKLNLVSPSQDEDIPTRQKPRLEEPIPTTKDEATRETASPDVSVVLSPPAAENDGANANADPVTDTQPNAGATGGWTLEEDAKLTRAVANTSKKKSGEEYKTNWPAIFEMVPGQAGKLFSRRWLDVLDPNIGRASGRKGKWSAVEDSKLKDAVQTHDDKDWGAISALIQGRTRKRCYNRWNDVLDPNIGRANRRTGKWAAVEDSKLKDTLQTRGYKDWGAMAALVPRRTNKTVLR